MMRNRSLLSSLFSPWVFLGAVLIAILLFGAIVFALVALVPDAPGEVSATAIMVVIEAPTVTPIPPTPMPTAVTSPTAPVPPAPPAGSFAVGDFVQITGTGGDGLRVRSSPGLTGEVLFIGAESEVFQVVDGPREVDNYAWWYLKAPYDETRTGWAVANYLTQMLNP